jgi:hypothetical protein
MPQFSERWWGSQSWLPPAISRRFSGLEQAAWKGGSGQDCPPHNKPLLHWIRA